MFQGHRGANHPVKRLADGAVEITSMNHGFAVEREGLPDNVRETHVSLFDDSNCGIELTDRPGVQRAISPRGKPGPAGQLLSVREVRGDDAVKRMRLPLVMHGAAAVAAPACSRMSVESCAERCARLDGRSDRS